MPLDFSRARPLLQGCALPKLFIEELGWEPCRQKLTLRAGETDYAFTAIAGKRGFTAWLCESPGGGLPDHATRLKLDRKLSGFTAEELDFILNYDIIRRLGIRSIAMPPLGCGLGGLDWNKVRPMIERAFANLPDVRLLLFAPSVAPEAKTMPGRTERPKLTVARALFIRLMNQYAAQSYRLTLLQIQKLAYFLQEAGQPLRLRYQAGHFGPYAPNLKKVLETLECHYTSGYGDSQKPDVEIELLPGASGEAEAFLSDHAAEHERLARVNQLIEGYETPYGLEVLSSVHWLAVHGSPAATSPAEAVAGIGAWNERKRQMFRPEHIRLAWDRLAAEGWINYPRRSGAHPRRGGRQETPHPGGISD